MIYRLEIEIASLGRRVATINTVVLPRVAYSSFKWLLLEDRFSIMTAFPALDRRRGSKFTGGAALSSSVLLGTYLGFREGRLLYTVVALFNCC